ncbi:hypothetical protein BGX27_011219 [Mortierella sp. AM989]|nr:hypothetical protein BGX27_011219 [Mortierella sp. AM989]
MLFSRQPRATKAFSLFVSLFCTAWLSSVNADITCEQPSSGTFKAGDPITLNWAADGSGSQVRDIQSMEATLNCDSGTPVGSVTITNWAQAFIWTVPSVGNATTVGGTTGTCAGNSFHVVYSGMAMTRFALIPISKSYRAPCKSITILPAPNGTITTTAPASTTATATTTSGKPTKSSSSSVSPTPTDPSGSESDSKPKTFIIVIVAIVAGLILFLVAFGTWWYLRKQRIERMKNAIMPWASQPGNQFAKVSSMDEGHRTGSINGAAAGVASKHNKPQPNIPQPQKSHYQEDNYNYNQHGGYGGNGRQQGYENHEGYNNGDDFYNPHYATQGYGASPPSSNATYYGGNRTPYQDPRDPYQSPHQQPGYFPPPPPVVSGASSPTASSGSQLNTLSSEPTSIISSNARSPQMILPEKGSPSEDELAQEIPMKVLVKS